MYLQAIKKYCEGRDGGLRQLAEDIGMSEANLHRCIRLNKIQASDLENIARLLNISVSAFFDDDEDADVSGHHNQLNKEGAHDNINIAGGDLVLEEKVKHLEEIIKSQEAIISEKDERIKDLKDLIEILRTKN
jgi:DNA-binding Xre family transcriptional regulator